MNGKLLRVVAKAFHLWPEAEIIRAHNHEPETRSGAKVSTRVTPPAGDVFLADKIVRCRPLALVLECLMLV